MLREFVRNTVHSIRAINRRYANPHIQMTRRVRWSLGLLRGYLLFLVGIMVYKFIITAMHR
jgi:hypothetical protein